MTMYWTREEELTRLSPMLEAVDVSGEVGEEAEAQAQRKSDEDVEGHGTAHVIACTADTVVAALTSAVRVAS